jgi:hypothetical protein
MKIELARCIPDPMRQGMTAEAMALAYDASTNLGKAAVLHAIAAVMESIGDPVEKFWIEDGAGRRRTYKIEQALAVVENPAVFRYLWTLPESERKNRRSRWLTAAAIDNIAVNRATLFFALPRGVAQEFTPHLTLIRLLAQADIAPQYGFGYRREYGGPDYFAVGYVSNARARNPAEHPDRYRYARGLLLDVFPMNVLSDIHLQQRLGGASFREWILRNTGAESLLQIGPRSFAWFVPAACTAFISAQLREFGLIIRGRSATSARTLNRMGSSVRYQC